MAGDTSAGEVKTGGMGVTMKGAAGVTISWPARGDVGDGLSKHSMRHRDLVGLAARERGEVVFSTFRNLEGAIRRGRRREGR